jgi:hypothetical protein
MIRAVLEIENVDLDSRTFWPYSHVSILSKALFLYLPRGISARKARMEIPKMESRKYPASIGTRWNSERVKYPSARNDNGPVI